MLGAVEDRRSGETYLIFTVLSRIVDPSVAWETVPPPVAASPAVVPAVAPAVFPVLLFGRFLPLRGRASDCRMRDRKKKKDRARNAEKCRKTMTPRRRGCCRNIWE